MRTLTQSLVALVLAIGLSFPALALDRVTLTDGRVFEGEILRQTENFVQIRVSHGGLETTHVFYITDIESVEEDVSGTGESDDAEEVGEEESKPTRGGPEVTTGATKQKAANPEQTPGVIVLPLEGMVGTLFRHEEIEKVAEEADRIKRRTGISPIIVLEIESGGGAVPEAYEIHETLMKIKKEHRVVAWIKQAISAAAATAFHCDEIYFMTEGNLGAMTMFNAGTGESVQGEELQEWLDDASAWAEEGGRPGMVARAMVSHPFQLSYDKDPETGEVTWYPSLDGEYDLSDEFSNLSFNVSTAVHSGFADGRADTREELARLLDLSEWHEMSDVGRDAHQEWEETYQRAVVEIPRIYGRIQIMRGSAKDQAAKIREEIKYIKQLIRWSRRAPNVVRYEVPVPPVEQLERWIEELERALRNLRRGGGG